MGGEVGSLGGGHLRGISGDSVHDCWDSSHGTHVGAVGAVYGGNNSHGGNNTHGVQVGGGSSSGGGLVVGDKVGGLGGGDLRGVGYLLGQHCGVRVAVVLGNGVGHAEGHEAEESDLQAQGNLIHFRL